MTFEFETHPGGEEGDNLVKTKLATGEMNDIFYYNSGSLLQALSPDRTIEPLTGDPALDTVSEGFLPAVTFDDEIYGVPAGPGFAGGILYNKDVYRRPRSRGADDMGGVRGQQRDDQGGRDSARARHVRRRLDRSAVRPRRLLQRRPAGARVHRAVHEQRGQVRHHPGRAAGFPAPGGGRREGLVSGRLPVDHARRRARHAGEGRGRPLSDAQRRRAGHRGRQPRHRPRRSVSSPSRATVPTSTVPPSGCRTRSTSPRTASTRKPPRTSSGGSPRSRAPST